MIAPRPSPGAGRVALVGAGPGDPDLITMRGAELLASADVVVHDRLVDPELLARARRAELIDVGKQPGGAKAMQEAIHAILIERARRGAFVVRLKGGDPFVFGRGSEELDACRAAGIPCEVVPGVSSAFAAAAAAGIPVTERGIARSVAIVTARQGEGLDDTPPDYAALARMDTVVVLMGRERVAEFARGLIAAGRAPTTPAAMIERGTWRAQREVNESLGAIAEAAERARIASPAVLLIGPTAARAGRQAMRSLEGVRVLMTRPPSASRGLVRTLRERGADVIDAPLIRIRYPDPLPALPPLKGFQWLVVTSLHGVRGLARALDAQGLDARALAGPRVAAIGAKTASELERVLGVRADLVPAEHRATALTAAIGAQLDPGDRVFFPCGTLAREETAATLRGHGAEVVEWTVYETLPAPPDESSRERIRQGIDAALLYSPSGVRSLVEHRVDLGDALLICVGPTTADAVRAAGVSRLTQGPIVAERYGDEGVLEALERAVRERRRSGGQDIPVEATDHA